MKKLMVLLAVLLSGKLYAEYSSSHGFADLHAHLSVELAFGGGWYHGHAHGPEHWALRRCSGGHDHATISGVEGKAVSELFGWYGGTSGDTWWHTKKRNGFDNRRCQCLEVFGQCTGVNIPGTCPKENYREWPAWDSVAHQQMWHGHLKQAFEGGLKVMIASTVESKMLCENIPSRNISTPDCNEMNSVIRQIEFLHQFAEEHSDWAGIALSSDEARLLNHNNKLAIVIGVEISELFPADRGDFLEQLQEFYDLGVRSLQIVHHKNNRFSGAAPIHAPMEAADFLGYDLGFHCEDANGNSGKCNGFNRLNNQGLSADGETLIRAMYDLGMILDVSHVSRKSFKQIHGIAMELDYPYIYSHAHLWDSVDKNRKNEKYITDEEIQMIKEIGSIVGLRTGPEHTHTHQDSNVSNNCKGSSRSFAQTLAYSHEQGLPIAFGTDLNGAIQQTIPRHGDKDESCYGNEDQQNLQTGNTGNYFDTKGLGHIGLLPALIKDLEQVGAKEEHVAPLKNSAETFYSVWFRAEHASRPPIKSGNLEWMTSINYLLSD